jgi:hypothetical protein
MKIRFASIKRVVMMVVVGITVQMKIHLLRRSATVQTMVLKEVYFI